MRLGRHVHLRGRLKRRLQSRLLELMRQGGQELAVKGSHALGLAQQPRRLVALGGRVCACALQPRCQSIYFGECCDRDPWCGGKRQHCGFCEASFANSRVARGDAPATPPCDASFSYYDVVPLGS